MIKKGLGAALFGVVLSFSAYAQQAPVFETRKITDNVYIFRYQGHQSMFVVTPAGVIATDPISLRRPEAAKAYIAEIQKITKAPIKYVIYSHHHYDHIAGGKPFKDLGATFIAHKNAVARLKVLKNADIVPPDIAVGDRREIVLGGVKVELRYVGRNHTDNSLVILVPKDKIAFAVDFIPVEALGFRVIVADKVEEQGESLSSTLIRRALERGAVAAAAHMLGRPYRVGGQVIGGQRLGRTLGVPTANIALSPTNRLAFGVYAVNVSLGGRVFGGVASFGVRPTVDNGPPLLETYILDFAEDIYGRHIEVDFTAYLRPELKFDGLPALKTAMAKDIADARQVWERQG